MAIACSDCGTVQAVPELPPRTIATCHRCGRTLDRAAKWSLTTSLAWTVATLLLLIPANALPLMQAQLQDQSRQVYIASGVTGIWKDGWPFLAIMFALFALVLPLLRASLMILVLTTIRLNHRPSWLGRIFRYAEELHIWAMPEVVTLAGFVIYMRVAAQLQGEVTWGGWCLLAAAVLSLLTPQILSRFEVWRAILPDQYALPYFSASSGHSHTQAPTIGCISCNMVLPLSFEGEPCPRCRRRLYLRKPNAMHYTAALIVASYILYFPAYYYPMSFTIQPNGIQEHTIMSGVKALAQAGFWYLGSIIFIASILIPFLKLVGLSWLLMRVYYPTTRHLALHTRMHRIIHHIGRWSNTDPFIVAIMVPLFSFTGIADAHVGKAALPFALVATLTMLASRCFDPRLLWDAAEGRL